MMRVYMTKSSTRSISGLKAFSTELRPKDFPSTAVPIAAIIPLECFEILNLNIATKWYGVSLLTIPCFATKLWVGLYFTMFVLESSYELPAQC